MNVFRGIADRARLRCPYLAPYLSRLAPSDRDALFVLSVHFVSHNGRSLSHAELLAGSVWQEMRPKRNLVSSRKDLKGLP